MPGSGALLAKVPDKTEQIPVPLKHTDVSASVCGYIATVDVTQQYQNPFDSKIEAIYVFPLPHNAAVSEFVMTVGERKIRGIIREREQAEQIYNEAKSQGYVASLLTQERPNIFTQSVANIEPGKQIDINIKYFHTLAYVDGWYEFVFPMVVGPRFNPPGTTSGVAAVGRGAPGRSGQATGALYLKPHERSGHDIAIKLDIYAGVPIERVESLTHRIDSQATSASKSRVTLRSEDSIPNRDLVVRYKVAGDRMKSALVTHTDARGGYFTLMVYPPETPRDLPRQPMEMVFVLDCSGSMDGEPIKLAKQALEHALKQLNPSDTFQIVRFSDQASQLGPRPVDATPKNIQRALDLVRGLNGEGGTMMIEGIKSALDFPHDPRRLRFVCFLTDGYIGNESEILAEVHKRLGETRIFSFGIGTATNRFLLEHMAKLGRGAAAFVGPGDDSVEIMSAFMKRITQPAMTDLAIDWGGMIVSEVYPARPPDLFAGRPVILTGRFTGDAVPSSAIRIRGRVGGVERDFAVSTQPADVKEAAAALPSVWARTKIADLCDRSLYEQRNELPQVVRQTALEYSLMSSYTAFVAVDSLTRTLGDHGTTVAVPVPVPPGVRYETTVEP
jgi:Ca-activated chloride channel family protein